MSDPKNRIEIQKKTIYFPFFRFHPYPGPHLKLCLPSLFSPWRQHSKLIHASEPPPTPLFLGVPVNTFRIRTLFVTLALVAFSLGGLLVGCGGSASAPAAPADTIAPTLAITGTTSTPTSAPVTLTFIFSEDVGTSFVAADVTVTNGTAAVAVTKVDTTHYTLVVTPALNSSGNMTASVAIGAFSDVAGNANTAAVTATQPYNTVLSYTVEDFNTAGVTYKATDFGGTASVITSTGVPAGGPANKVVQITKTSGAEVWAGTTLSVGYLDSIPKLPFSATAHKISAVIYSATATSFKLKVEDANDGTHSVETDAVTAAAGWQTLTFDFATQSSGTAALNLAYTYNKVSIFPAFGAAGTGLVYYVGPLTFIGASAPAAPALADTVAPTVTISGTSGTAITGPVTLTFTFSEDVGTSFTASDVTVTGATAASSVTKVDATHYTLLVTPPTSATGSITIGIAVGAFSDLVGNLNAAAASATQTYNTVVAVASYAVIDFNTSGLTYKATDFGGTATTLSASGAPAGGPSTPVAKVIKTTGAQSWGGTTFSVGYLDSVGRLPFSASNTTLMVVIYCPTAGVTIKLKAEDAQDPTHTVEADVTAAAGWQTLTFNMATQAAGTAALNLAFTFNKVSIFPEFGTTPAVDKTYYVGPITFMGATGPSAPPLSAPTGATAPTTVPATPSVAAANVISLYTSSATYTNVPVDTWGTSWSVGTASDYTIVGTSKVVKKYATLQYAGMEFLNPGPHLNLSTMTHMHVDVWTPDATQFSVKLVGFSGNTAGAEFQVNYTSSTITKGTWVSLEIPLSSFTGVTLSSIGQLLWVDNTPNVENGTFFLDNIYFHK